MGFKIKADKKNFLASEVIYFPTNGFRTQVSDVNIKSSATNREIQKELSVINYDRLNNLMKRSWIPDLLPHTYLTGKRTITNINTRDIQVINKFIKNSKRLFGNHQPPR